MDASDRMTGYTALNEVEYTLSCEGTSRQPKTVVSDGITTTYTYDTAGNITQTKVQAPSNGKYLESSAEYDATKNFQTKTATPDPEKGQGFLLLCSVSKKYRSQQIREATGNRGGIFHI